MSSTGAGAVFDVDGASDNDTRTAVLRNGRSELQPRHVLSGAYLGSRHDKLRP
jgi:hypothetical protein